MPFETPSKPYPHGTFAKIARRFGVTPQAVSLVAQGKSKSRRIEAELRREWRKARKRAPVAAAAPETH